MLDDEENFFWSLSTHKPLLALAVSSYVDAAFFFHALSLFNIHLIRFIND